MSSRTLWKHLPNLRPHTPRIILFFGLIATSLACAPESAHVSADEPMPEFTTHVDGLGTIALRGPVEVDDQATRVLHVALGSVSRDIHVRIDEPVFQLSSLDPVTGSVLWNQSYRTIDGSRKFEVLEEAGGYGLRWIRENLGDGLSVETFYTIGLESVPLVCRIDESQPSRIEEERRRLRAWIPQEVRDAVFDNAEGTLVNALPQLARDNVELIGDYAPPAELRVPEENWFQLACLVATGCTMLKCTLGGPLNPLCTICSGVVIDCAICTLFNIFGISCT